MSGANRYLDETRPLSSTFLEKDPMLISEGERVVSPTPVPRGRRKLKFFALKYYVPVLVISIQTILLVFGWTFFAVTTTRPVALPDYLAIAARNQSQAIVMVITLIASVLSLITTFLYTRAIRYALARFLTKPTGISLYTMAAAIKVSMESPVLDFRRLEWAITSIILMLAVGAQTAGWTTLLTPKRIAINAGMEGYELDIASPDFQRLMLANQAVVTPDLFINVIPLIEASGSTAVSTRFALPSILNFNQLSYINSTNGVMPTSYAEMYSTSRSAAGTVIPSNTNITKLAARPSGFPISFSMTQQGFTANVTCRQQALDATTSPSMTFSSRKDTIFNTSITLAQMSVRCPGATDIDSTTPVLTSANVDAVFGVSCPVTEPNGSQHWDLIFSGSGNYKFINTTICSIFPLVTSVNVDYNDATKFFNSSSPSFINGSNPWGAIDSPWVGEYTLSMFLRGLVVSQSTTGNSVGDTISAFLTNIPFSENALSEILQAYVRGVLEFSVTLLRTAYTQSNNNLYPGGESEIPEDMRIRTNGTFKTETIGWHQQANTAPAVFLAPTLIMVASMLIVIVTMMKTSKLEEPMENAFFDPGNLLHVISASAAGGINERFPPFEENPKVYCSTVDLKLGPVPGSDGRTGFVHVR